MWLAPRIPFDRPDLLALAPTYRTLRSRGPINAVQCRDVGVAWLVTDYRYVYDLLADHRLDRFPPDVDAAAKTSNAAMRGGGGHQAMRRLLNPALSVRGLEEFGAEIRRIVTEVLDDVAASPAPLDLHEALAVELPTRVICAFLGVPPQDRVRLTAWSTASGVSLTADPAVVKASREGLMGYFLDLVQAKRATPARDLISELLAVDDMADQQIAGLASAGLFAGHETTTPRIDSGLLLLHLHREDREALRREPALVGGAVEEILRMPVPGQDGSGPPRYAQEDLRIGDVTVRAGEKVLLAGGAANFDPQVFPDPDRFDIRRTPNPHLTFGRGIRFCLGSGLARMELQELFTQFTSRFPDYRLACDVNAIKPRDDLLTGGVDELPAYV